MPSLPQTCPIVTPQELVSRVTKKEGKVLRVAPLGKSYETGLQSPDWETL